MALEISVEFFPPQTQEGSSKLQQEVAVLAALNPSYFSVTYGAGGATREKTFATVQSLLNQGFVAAPHLSCIGSGKAQIAAILSEYQASSIKKLVALRGDLPSGMTGMGELAYASELVEFIRQSTGDYFDIHVAAYPEWHPQAKSPKDDIDHFVEKVNAGANAAITQYFYNADAYWRFCDEVSARGVSIPIFPGIMPIVNFSKLARFSDNCGTEIPRWMRKKFESFGDDHESIRSFGLDVVTTLCQQLMDSGCPGLHFYSMNQSAPVMEICKQLGV